MRTKNIEITAGDILILGKKLKHFKGYKAEMAIRLNKIAQSMDSLKGYVFTETRVNNIKYGLITNQRIRVLFMKVGYELLSEFEKEIKEVLRK